MPDHIITKNRVFVFLCFLIALSLLISFSRNLQANKQQEQTSDKKNYLPLVLKPGTLVPGNLPTSTGTHTATPGPSPTTGPATSTLTPQPENCPTHFEGQAVAGNTHVLVTGVVGTDVSIILADTGETLATTTLIAVSGHDCAGFADFIAPIHPALSMALEEGWLLLAVNDNGSFDETFVIGQPAPPTNTVTPFMPINTNTPTATQTHTPEPPYITLLPDCSNNNRITFIVQGFNWPPDATISLFWKSVDAMAHIDGSQHNGSFSRTFTYDNVEDGSYDVLALSDIGGYSSTATFHKPCMVPTSTSTATPTAIHTATLTPTPTNTATPTSDATATSTATVLPPLTNLCLNAGVSATQSSTNSGGVASRACDGNTDGDFDNFSVSRTNSEATPYWEVSLGRTYVLQQIKLYNRTDADMDDLSNFYVFTTNSINGFASTDLNATRNDRNVREYFLAGGVDALAFALNNVVASHIRIQLAGTANLNLAEVEIIGASHIVNRCETLADVFYIFDVSGSMSYEFPGADSKIDAAKDAIITVNNEIAASGDNSRVGFVTFTTDGTYYDDRTRLHIALDTYYPTTNIANVNALVQTWQAVGGTPTGSAINSGRLTFFDTWDPLRVPVIVLISDGVPTVDQDGLFHRDDYVQAIDVYDNDGNPYTPDQVASTGNWGSGTSFYSSERAGYVVAETMREILELKNSLPDAAVHSVAISSSYFNTDVHQYIADAGGGQYFQAGDANSLTEQLLAIYNSISCTPDQ